MFPILQIRLQKMSELFDYQENAITKLETGSILCGGVGSGKSLTALAYYLRREYPKTLYVITTATKRDTGDWKKEYNAYGGVKSGNLVVDSWNNIGRYVNTNASFFIFDEQRVVGSGSWVKSFLKITKNNNWILLSATPGDNWMDYVPVFVANGFYKNRTDFIRQHVVYNMAIKFPKVDHYVNTSTLSDYKEKITVYMQNERVIEKFLVDILVEYDSDLFNIVRRNRWNPYINEPIKNVSEYYSLMRKVVNSDLSRLWKIKELIKKHRKIIVFYNFDYELNILRTLKEDSKITVSEHNGHIHEPLPDGESWVYLVQYLSGSEGWNCVETNTVVFYSLNYSYRIMVQAKGRIDRLNTPFMNLYYYSLISNSFIDNAISRALKNKKDFNRKILERDFNNENTRTDKQYS
jgi:hypothetical protein